MDKASVESQLGTAQLNISDTEEIMRLRNLDDLKSRTELANALFAQFRYKEAADILSEAAGECDFDKELYLKIGGAYLTAREFDKSLKAHEKYLELGGSEQAAAYPMGIWHFFRQEYEKAADSFAKCLPCDDEMMICVVYWHCLSMLRAGGELEFLKYYRKDMEVGHHTAYRLVVRVLAGETAMEAALEELKSEKDVLNYCIAGYGLYCIKKAKGEPAEELLDSILDKKDLWPCIAYLAAWNDRNGL